MWERLRAAERGLPSSADVFAKRKHRYRPEDVSEVLRTPRVARVQRQNARGSPEPFGIGAATPSRGRADGKKTGRERVWVLTDLATELSVLRRACIVRSPMVPQRRVARTKKQSTPSRPPFR